MKILILDGCHSGDSIGKESVDFLMEHLSGRNASIEHIRLVDEHIGICRGCFLCWLKTPGQCIAQDANTRIAQKYIESDLVVMIAQTAFGHYASGLKLMLDHLVQNITPLLVSIHGETHHLKRYVNYPDSLSIGIVDEPDAEAEAILRNLSSRNAINYYAERYATACIARTDSKAQRTDALVRLLDGYRACSEVEVPELPHYGVANVPAKKINRALLLIGSPRMEKSSSASLGNYLFDGIERHGVAVQRHYLYRMLNDDEMMHNAFEAVAASDLTVLAFPLYVDSLPAPVHAFLERLAGYRKQKGIRGGGFAVIANCGFIESSQNNTAIAGCALFASKSGFKWMGGVSLGGGEGLVHGVPLKRVGMIASPVCAALDGIAEALAGNQPIPIKERARIAKPFIVPWLYRFFANRRFRRDARRFGMQHSLKRRPYGA